VKALADWTGRQGQGKDAGLVLERSEPASRFLLSDLGSACMAPDRNRNGFYT
jgi:hypothetical protein